MTTFKETKFVSGGAIHKLCVSSFGRDLKDWNGVFGKNAQWWALFPCDTPDGASPEPYAVCTTGLHFDKMAIFNLCVGDKHRRKGYGRRLLSQIVEKFGSDYTLFLFVDKTNRPAISLYRSFGFFFTMDLFVPPQGEICMKREN